MTGDVFDVIRSGPALINAATQRWLVPGDIDAPAVVFVHGFTSHGRYMNDLAAYARGHGFVSILFNYDSFSGIDRGAVSLRDRLAASADQLAEHGYAIVAHSMGGLVALEYACETQPPLLDSLKGVVLLGVPNRGTLANRKIVSYMLDWADTLTGPNPYARSPACRAALQLTGNDPEKLLASLASKAKLLGVPIASISGGMNYLEFGPGQWTGNLRNSILQHLIGETPNDGLVAESSSDAVRALGVRNATHHNGYTDYLKINHTFLNRNQQIGNLIMEWLHKAVFARL